MNGIQMLHWAKLRYKITNMIKAFYCLNLQSFTKIFETDYSFYANFLLVLTKFSSWQEEYWALGYYSMKF